MSHAAISRPLTPDELDRMGAELDAIRSRVADDLGEREANHIRRMVKWVRYTEAAGRGLLFASFFPPAWVAGSVLLGVSKILENMEVGHNIIHGQYDWMQDPAFKGKTYEWDIVGTSENWRTSHNFSHHTYTNIRGMDDDIGYGTVRLFPEQRWKPVYLLQPLYAIIFALLFQWGVAIQELRIGRVVMGKKSKAQLKEEFGPLGKKWRRQLIKDYVVFPLLAGPFFLPVFLGNLVANGIRNIWTFSVIFCGHFTAEAEVFPKSVLENESRGHWYLRQIRGSSNLEGGKLFHIMTGHLSHQIEHHLFPDLPAVRYPEIAVEVKEICKRYGINYNTGTMFSQYGQVIGRILRHAFPSRPAREPALLVAANS